MIRVSGYSVGPAPPPAVAPSAAPAVDAPRPTSAVDAPRPTRVVTVTPSATAPDPTSTRPVIVTSPAVPVPVVEPAPPEPTPAAPPPVGRFQVNGAVDSAWLESQGRRFGVGNVAPGSYTLHARWGSVEVERKVTVAAGQTLVATCDATFFNCVVR